MNWNMIGHEWAVHLLQEHIAHDRLRHAYLFTGPQGIGRRTLALRFAQALNCTQPSAPGEPCGQCRACRGFQNMEHPDLTVVQAETEGGILKVEQVRDLQRSLSLAPYEARYRVALLLRFEEANPNAANALLKTLEEPPSKVVLLLTASDAESLLPTIVSRCEVLRLRSLPLEHTAAGLQERWNLPQAEARFLAHVSLGCLGQAVRLHQHSEALEQRQAWLDEHTQLLSSDRVTRFNFAESLAKDKDQARQALLTWLSLWRDVLVRAAGASAELANIDREQEVDALARRLGADAARQTLAALERTLVYLEKNVNTRLACEILMLDLPHL